MSSRAFKILVPFGPTRDLYVTGAIGGTPDTAILGSTLRCRRNSLPPFLNRLTFNLRAGHGEIPLANFYHMGDFFVVSTEVMEFLRDTSGAQLQVASVNVTHDHGLPIEGIYWAVKIQTTIDCIDPTHSLAIRWPLNSDPPQPFSELVSEFLLDDDLAPQFSNDGTSRYRSYPNDWVTEVALRESAIPEHLALFEPAFWPGNLIVEEKYAEALQRTCRGGSREYFWTLGLKEVSKQHDRLRFQNR